MNITNISTKLARILLLGAFIFAAGGCDDRDDLITENQFDRLFMPSKLETRIQNKTNVRLSWECLSEAESFVIELFADDNNMNFEGTANVTATATESPYVISNLLGETTYSARIKAVSGSLESKWSNTTFKTDAEQIFYAVDPNDMEANEVTLRWPAGQAATLITVTPGDISYTVTAQDVAAGAATITGLTGETQYTAVLKNGEKTRGQISFTTPVDLGGAIAVTTEDDLAALIAAAEEGDVFALFPGEYVVPTLAVSKTISIKGVRPGDRPVLKSTLIRLKAGAGAQLSDLILDGTGANDGNQAVIYDEDLTDGVYAPISIENCWIKNYTKGAFYVNFKCNIESVTIRNSVFSNIECTGGDFIDFRAGVAQSFEFTNNTAYNSCAARDFFRMDAGGSTNFTDVKSIINISNNTFYNVANNSSKRVLYVRLANHEITFNKNILAETQGYYTNQSATTIVEMANNNYFNAPNFTGSTVSKAQNDSGEYTTLDPGFKNAAEGDFTLTNEDLIYKGIGDQRWR